jgi:hypothetical protein
MKPKQELLTEPVRKVAEPHSYAARLLGQIASAARYMFSPDVQNRWDSLPDGHFGPRASRAQPLAKSAPQSGLDLEPRSLLEN